MPRNCKAFAIVDIRTNRNQWLNLCLFVFFSHKICKIYVVCILPGYLIISHLPFRYVCIRVSCFDEEKLRKKSNEYHFDIHWIFFFFSFFLSLSHVSLLNSLNSVIALNTAF